MPPPDSLPPVMLGTLEERLRTSAGVALEEALESLERQYAVDPDTPDPVKAALGARAGAEAAPGTPAVGWRDGLAGTFPVWEAGAFLQSVQSMPRAAGAEHEVRFDAASNRVCKFSVAPIGTVNEDELTAYVKRMAWCNEIFQDDIQIEGWVTFPGETGSRLVISQPWYRTSLARAPHPDEVQIWSYMAALGFLRAYEGVYYHGGRNLVVSDAVGKNFVIDAAGRVYPVDLYMKEPGGAQQERLETMVYNQAQRDRPEILIAPHDANAHGSPLERKPFPLGQPG